MSFNEEKQDGVDIEDLTSRKNSETEVLKALELREAELDEYKLKLITRTNQASNQILENHHSMTVENRILNFFIFAFTIFIVLQFSLILIMKLDIDWPSLLQFISFEDFYQISWLCILVIVRCYIGVKIFRRLVKTNILFKLLNYQFMGFLKSTLMTMGINILVSMDYIGNHEHVNRVLDIVKQMSTVYKKINCLFVKSSKVTIFAVFNNSAGTIGDEDSPDVHDLQSFT
ncbi:hypothetical protein WICANDRAFT_81245 [Wickerhamomyces anomalus NRRL Y-366-8]|uniref:Uncharacterized protein n=1 Tax=Wickerhamomyces anomalus (strain ATCC 58044 / CBS 1984 / NCYC 433 / NRRL Y-366-8) TaxID=683960 RepID=A0A1E3NWF6_WICAA|nr:uncharacterized protein WICANDRAFT_81245 [Wickerhamomyces anomalus NRRL Y-366-8]ODQ57012.1 hypothetical protein WICANDRAFT_81245 [Wickerhamomyces anomalus NRRL Y-366-8]